MLDIRKDIVDKLEETLLPVYYDMNITDMSVPCITYSVIDDSQNRYGNTIGYSDIVFQIKVWAMEVEDIATYTTLIDALLRPIGLHRTYFNELTNKELLIGVMQYTGLCKEDFLQEI